MLDLTEQDLNEDQFLVELRRAFDKGDEITEVSVNSATALNLHSSPSVHLDDDGCNKYHSPFGAIRIVPVSYQEMNQTSIGY